jgi:hypothetical protein
MKLATLLTSAFFSILFLLSPLHAQDYIQNTTAVQTGANFNIGGNGTVGGTISGSLVNSVTQYNINGSRVLSNAGTYNLFAGVNAGIANSLGGYNAFFGSRSGDSNTSGHQNSFFGAYSGDSNTSGGSNSFFGYAAGTMHETGEGNSFFGAGAGLDHFSGSRNTFVGISTGTMSPDEPSGSDNTVIGAYAQVSTTANFATAIGAGSYAGQSNSIYLGRSGGQDTVRVPGNLVITKATTMNGNLSVTGATTMNGNLVFASGGIALFQSNIILTSLGSAGSAHICRNSSNQLSTCSSSLRYKTNVNRFGLGLSLVNKLRPITFDWKDGGLHDLGLGAEDVAAIEPLLVTYNKDGQVEGVKYDRIGVVLLNAVKEQQKQIEHQQQVIDGLKKLVCQNNSQAEVCK